MEERELLRILEVAFIYLKKDVNYKETKRKYQQALEEIVALIKKPAVTEEWIDRKAMELAELFRNPNRVELHKAVINTEYFIRSLVEEIK